VKILKSECHRCGYKNDGSVKFTAKIKKNISCELRNTYKSVKNIEYTYWTKSYEDHFRCSVYIYDFKMISIEKYVRDVE
jgi:hypothetical protein